MIPLDVVREQREYIADMLQPGIARAYGVITSADIIEMVLQSEMDMWGIFERKQEPEQDADTLTVLALICTQIMTYRAGKKALRISFLSGKGMNRWLHLISVLEDFGREHDCGTLEIHGRKGWGRMLPDYPELYRVFRKEL